MSTTNLADVLTAYRDRIIAIGSRYGVRDVRVFGSVARGDAHGGSDVDLLVRLDDGRSLFDLGGGMPTRVSIAEARLPEVMTKINDQ